MAGPGSHRLDTLVQALGRALRGKPKKDPPARDNVSDWQKFIEVQLDALNRRLTRVEIIAMILLVLTVVADVNKAADLLRALITP